MRGLSETPFGAGAPTRARAEFVSALRLIAIVAAVLVPVSLWYVSLFGTLTLHMVIATTFGVSLSILLGCGLFAAAFFSAKSGHDQQVTDATRPGQLGLNPTSLPEGLTCRRRTATFTETSVPTALLADHDTKPGSWGLIHVSAGRLRYRVTDPRRTPLDMILTPDTAPGVVEPTILHHVEPLGPGSFHIAFWRAETA